ncbi:murein biosynthesis integral membrane protein MurJ, partial [Nocardioides sp.]|uniref:murein biosynthesis integral membrane protein MurJ n=1 Tax=Nocardioides sp. TaxID=35761 RepID=UPI003563977E
MSLGPSEEAGTGESRVLANSAVMAAGTVVSRMSGYVRSILLAAALGNLLHADVFTIANTVPNTLYLLLAGGIFNAVLVPQLVRAAKNDADRGEAYTNRVITLAALFLGIVTIALVAGAPLVMELYLNPGWPPEARDSAIDLARYCLPQVFFYGMYVLVGQILNAHGRFGPMMWAPIANNVIAVSMLATYLVVFGADDPRAGGYTMSREALLGIGSTLGIVAQFVILVPFLRAAGVRVRPRFDFVGTGLSKTLRLGVWTLLFVIVNQIAYTVVVRLASGGTAAGGTEGTGYAVYSSAFLIMMVPHSVITVSLATAILPGLSRRAASEDLPGMGALLAGTLRTALVVVIPVAAILPIVAPALARVLFGYGAAAPFVQNYVPSLALFGPGLVVFTTHYFMLRGFYALEQTRTVFFIQCAVAATNIVAAVILVGATSDRDTSPALVGAYTAAYLVGAGLSTIVLRRHLGSISVATGTGWSGFALRVLVTVAVATAVAGGVRLLL